MTEPQERPTGKDVAAEAAVAMRWRRRGLLLRVPEEGGGTGGWWRSHAQAATPLVLEPRRWRLYFSGRDRQNRSRILFVDVDPLDDMRVIDRHFEPVLELGPPGSFDSAGQGACAALLRDGLVHLYYAGIHLRRDVPYGLAIGLAVSTDGRRFEAAGPGPVLAPGPDEPWFCSVAHVTEATSGAGLAAWYTSGAGWVALPGGGFDPVYGLASAHSPDGIRWRLRPGTRVPASAETGSLTRPWAATIRGQPRLFFAQRDNFGFRSEAGSAYRLRHLRLDAAGRPTGAPAPVEFATPPQPGEWDGFMQAYPSVLPLQGGYVMFYNGDGFGGDGFGWATLDL